MNGAIPLLGIMLARVATLRFATLQHGAVLLNDFRGLVSQGFNLLSDPDIRGTSSDVGFFVGHCLGITCSVPDGSIPQQQPAHDRRLAIIQQLAQILNVFLQRRQRLQNDAQ